MPNTDLGACEPFIYELRRSNLIERGQLDQVLEEFLRRHPQAEPNALAWHLVSQNVLTQFQAERVLQGKTQGLVLGPYSLTDAVGSGSMGTVHKAQSKNDGKWYAVKVLPRRSMWNVRLARRQVRAFGQFSHPTVVPFVDVGTSGGLHYLVWNFVAGETLDAFVQRLGKLDAATAAQVVQQIASGLALAHQNGLFHGLLKPSNVMIGSGGQVHILDFGIGSLLAENEGESLVDTMSTANTLTSGLDCASPESIMEPTNRTPAGDQYSLGCVLYYCLTGRYPFAEGSAVEKMMAHQFKQPAPVTELAPETPPALIAVVERLMQKKPEERFPVIDDAVEALAPLVPPVISSAFATLPSQALTQTPVGPMSKNGPSSIRMKPKGSAHPTGPKGSAHPAAPPVSERPSAQAVPVPTRRSIRADLAPPSVTASMFHLDLPAAPFAMPTAETSPVMIPVQYPVEPGADAAKPALGPLGFLAIGATVAVSCYLLAQNFLAK